MNLIIFLVLLMHLMDCALFTDDDYQTLVDKYATVRKDFETNMTESCKVSSIRPVAASLLYIDYCFLCNVQCMNFSFFGNLYHSFIYLCCRQILFISFGCFITSKHQFISTQRYIEHCIKWPWPNVRNQWFIKRHFHCLVRFQFLLSETR